MKNRQIFKMTMLFAVALLFNLEAFAQKDMKYTFYLAYDSEDIVREQSAVATILSGEGLEVDGTEASTSTMRYANHAQNRPNSVVVDVVPGVHKVRVLRHISGGDIIMEPMVLNFEAGKVYRMGIKFLAMVIEEHPNKKIWSQIESIRKTAEYRQPE